MHIHNLQFKGKNVKNIILSLIIIFVSVSAFSQTFEIFDIDTTSFPIMKAKFFAFDSKGEQITALKISDFNIREEGNDRKIISVTCESNVSLDPVSTVLIMDASGSMRRRNILLAKSAARAWINAMPEGESETAITAFDEVNYMIQDFTNLKSLLLKKVETLFANGGTSYNAAFIDELFGGLLISKRAKNKKVLVILTDGLPNGFTLQDAIIDEAIAQQAVIYAVTLGLPCPEVLRIITEISGGDWFEDVTSQSEVENVYNQILKRVSGAKPCEIVWESDVSCSAGDRIADVDFYPFNTNRLISYTLPFTAIAAITPNPESIFFKNVMPGTSRDTIVNVKATNGDLTVSEIRWDNSAFEIFPRSFKIKKGETQQMRVSYTALPGGDYIWAKMEFVNNQCPLQLFASGGFAGKRPEKKTLALTHPNGGELFVAGNDTVITWEGIPETDSVRLEYSFDNGLSWVAVADKTNGGKHNWIRIPKTPSTECLMKVSQLQVSYDSNPFWARRMGSDFYYEFNDRHSGISLDMYGNIYIVSQFTGKITIDNKPYESKGEEDILIIKYSPDGKAEWINTIGGLGTDIASGITTDIFGNSYITGRFNQNIDFDTRSVFSRGSSDAFIAKILPDGAIEWLKNYGGSGEDLSNDICLDSFNNIIITGAYSQTAQFDKLNLTSNGGLDAFIAKFTPEGKSIWAQSNGGIYHDEGLGITTDNTGKIWASGKFSKEATFGSETLVSRGATNENADFDAYVANYFANGTMSWVVQAGGKGDDDGVAIACDSRGDAYLTGTFTQEANFGKYDILPTEAAENETSDIFIAKILANGTFYWVRHAGGAGNDFVRDIAVDVNDNAIITGSFVGIADFENIKIQSKGFFDAFVAKYTEEGLLDYVKRGGGDFADYGLSLALDSWGNSFVVGSFIKAGDFGSKVLTTDYGLMDVFLWGIGGGYDALQYDVSNRNWTIAAPEINAINIDMGNIFVGSTKDSLVSEFIVNTGLYDTKIDSIFITGRDAAAFGIVGKSSNIMLKADSDLEVEFRFNPVKSGTNNADIIIYTQSDTLRRAISGNGLKPDLQITNRFIDFGKVLVGEYKDSLNVLTISNNSTSPIEIISTKHNKPNDKDFSTISGGGNFVINSGETAEMDLRFSPSDKGRTSGSLEFHYKGIGSPAIIQLGGEGVNPNPSILVSNNFFDEIFCEKTASALVEVSNNGGSVLAIEGVNFEGINADNFSTNQSFPIIIDPDRATSIQVDFKSETPGVKNANMLISSNSKPDSLLSVPLAILMNGAKAEVSTKLVDFGVLDVNESAEKIISITNPGNYPTQVEVVNDGIIKTDNNIFSLLPKQIVELTISFAGTNQEGDFNSNIIIRDTLCKFESEVEVKAYISRGQNPLIAAKIDNFEILSCSENMSLKATISNLGKEDLIVESIVIEGSSSDEFSFEMPSNLIVKPSESINFVVNFNPKTIGLKNAEIRIVSNSANSPDYKIPIIASYEPVGYELSSEFSNLGRIILNKPSEFSFEIKNSGYKPNKFYLSHSNNVSLNFDNYVLNSGESVLIKGQYLEQENEKLVSESIIITDSICDSKKEFALTGSVGASPSFTLHTGSGEGFAGDLVVIPISITDIANLNQTNAESISLKLVFNSTILLPENQANYIDSDGIGTLEIIDIPIDFKSENTILNVSFRVGLGNSVSTKLIISDVIVNGDEAISTKLENGLFTSLGICNEGITRLINPNGIGGIIQINPNPGKNEKITINIEIIEKGDNKLGIYNSNGFLKEEFVFSEIGTKEIIINPNNYESGVYFIQYISPTMSQVRQMIIVK